MLELYMEEDILGKVVEVEDEIRRRLETEKVKAAEWLAKAGDEARQEVDRTREDLKGSLESVIKEAGDASREKAFQMIGDAESSAERLAGLGSEKLREIILRHISVILPEG